MRGGRGRPCILAVSGVKNTGKTTLIEAMIPLLTEAGLQVAVIKHDGHRFTPDTPGTDSFRFFAAGACGTAVFDDEKYAVVRRGAPEPEQLIACFPGADLILLEGFKESPYPKLELRRRGARAVSVSPPESRIAIVGDPDPAAAVPVLPMGDAGAAAALILEWIAQTKKGGDAI